MSLTNYLALKLATENGGDASVLAVVAVSVALIAALGFLGYVLWVISSDKY